MTQRGHTGPANPDPFLVNREAKALNGTFHTVNLQQVPDVCNGVGSKNAGSSGVMIDAAKPVSGSCWATVLGSNGVGNGWSEPHYATRNHLDLELGLSLVVVLLSFRSLGLSNEILPVLCSISRTLSAIS